MATFRIGLAIWSLGLTRSWNELESQLSTARELGAEGVQLWAVDYGPLPGKGEPCLLDPDRCGRECRSKVLELVESHGLEISGFCAQLSSPRKFGGFDDPEDLELRVEKTCKVLEMAADMGAPVVTTHPGLVPEDFTHPLYSTFKGAVLKVAKCAEDVGAYFCIETGMEPTHVLRRFLEDVGSPAVRVNYDPANLLRFGVGEVVRGVELLGPWIAHTHAKDHNPQTRSATVGEGLVPWREYLMALRRVGFSGWLALEDETGRNVVESLRKGRAFLQRLIAELGL